jgi:hypothetical protein
MGTSFLGFLGLTFIVLKLCGVIAWSWWLVTLPLWGGLAIGIGVMVLAMISAVIVTAFVLLSSRF